MGRRLVLHPVHAADAIRRMPPENKRRFRAALRLLRDDPTGTSVSLDVRVLDTDDEFPRVLRLRLGDWRAAFLVFDDRVEVVRVFHRGEGFGWLDDFQY